MSYLAPLFRTLMKTLSIYFHVKLWILRRTKGRPQRPAHPVLMQGIRVAALLSRQPLAISGQPPGAWTLFTPGLDASMSSASLYAQGQLWPSRA